MIRFMAEADLNDAIVIGCREGVSDPDVLALAAAKDRILVSHDLQTMPRHFGDFLQTRGSSPGLILVLNTCPSEK